MFMDVKVKCRRCGKEVRPEEMVLDYVYRMMVCPSCVKERKTGEQVKKELKQQGIIKEKPKPAGWDAEDDYLERVQQEREKSTIKVQKVDSDHVKYQCVKCKYSFLYNVTRKTPAVCPYCSTPIYRFRV
jgi:DNA-directed RNA polymerase subunit RPC12/RpoP